MDRDKFSKLKIESENLIASARQAIEAARKALDIDTSTGSTQTQEVQ
jgi:hypothetical protein